MEIMENGLNGLPWLGIMVTKARSDEIRPSFRLIVCLCKKIPRQILPLLSPLSNFIYLAHKKTLFHPFSVICKNNVVSAQKHI